MAASKECPKCGTIFPAAPVAHVQAPGQEVRCTVCGTDLKQLVDGEKGTPWSRRDTALWFLSFPGAEIIVIVAVVLGLFGVVAIVK